MDNIDPKLKEFWDTQTPKNGRQPPPRKAGRTVPIPLTAHPAVRHAAQQRYLHDEADLQSAGTRVKQAKPPWDVRALRWSGRWGFRLYTRVRGFVTAHLGRVTAQEREYRLTACEGCTFRKDQNGLLYCPPMLAKCGCGVWLLACLWWVTWLRKAECPIGRWKVPDEPAEAPGCKSEACPSKSAESPDPQ